MPLANLMDDGAVEAIRTRLTIKKGKDAVSLAYPLVVNNLVTLAMNEAAKIGAHVVTKELIAGC